MLALHESFGVESHQDTPPPLAIHQHPQYNTHGSLWIEPNHGNFNGIILKLLTCDGGSSQQYAALVNTPCSQMMFSNNYVTTLDKAN